MAAIFLISALLVTLSSAARPLSPHAVVHHGTPVDAADPKPHKNVHRSFSIADVQVKDFSMTSCGPKDMLEIKEIKLTPDLKLTVDVVVKTSLDETEPITVDVTLKKKVPFMGWITVQSRHIADACSLAKKFEDKCAANPFVKENNLPCSCPAPAGEYKVKDLDLKKMVMEAKQQRSLGSMLAGGRYSSRMEMKQQGRVIACSNVDLNLVMP
ncbi:hypothetical protein RvY_00749 [Ramazzottius varieornatus]|uniref:MD-2-related lipid-recognition domain-containing protein n=1 Tax=Ramazzottius varieornatus TaxID=947166 RepID=A0A1D1UK26_RAMVA|nr:hypothetical protein RvY_00749 [Ramazzottius varieornatus]